jgi:hypothetical protein
VSRILKLAREETKNTVNAGVSNVKNILKLKGSNPSLNFFGTRKGNLGKLAQFRNTAILS